MGDRGEPQRGMAWMFRVDEANPVPRKDGSRTAPTRWAASQVGKGAHEGRPYGL